jgi:hypothetical protein
MAKNADRGTRLGKKKAGWLQFGQVSITSALLHWMFMTVPQGSPLHCARALEHPRWEDYIFEPLDNVKNRFYWLGDGHTVADRAKDGDSKHVFFISDSLS